MSRKEPIRTLNMSILFRKLSLVPTNSTQRIEIWFLALKYEEIITVEKDVNNYRETPLYIVEIDDDGITVIA